MKQGMGRPDNWERVKEKEKEQGRKEKKQLQE